MTSMLGSDRAGPASSGASAGPLPMPAPISAWVIGISVRVAKYMKAPAIAAKALEASELPPTAAAIHADGIKASWPGWPRRKPNAQEQQRQDQLGEAPGLLEPLLTGARLHRRDDAQANHTASDGELGLCGKAKQLRAKFGVTAAGYGGFVEGLDALDRGDIEAFVAVEPVLRYEIANSYPARLAVIGRPFLHGDYVFAMPPNAQIRKAINQSLLAYIDSNEWQELLRQYLGDDR